MEELKKCPFCGGEAEMIAQWSEGARCEGYAVRCRSCFVKSGFYTSEQQAMEKWNRRPSPENKALTLDELREMDGEPVWCEFKALSPIWGICVHGFIRTGSGFKFKADVYEAAYYCHKPEPPKATEAEKEKIEHADV